MNKVIQITVFAVKPYNPFSPAHRFVDKQAKIILQSFFNINAQTSRRNNSYNKKA